jgi:two-component system, cell cycle sensor histidine kinase and response regulator CckA
VHTPYRIITRDGAVKWIEDLTTIQRGPDGGIIALEGILLDITERIHLEESRQTLQEQFHQAQKMESVGRLAAGVAHDFNNILSIIFGYGELLLQNLPPDHADHYKIAQIYAATQRAQSLTHQLLAFSRKQVLEIKTVGLNRVVVGFKQLLERIIGEDIELALKLGPKETCVKADAAQLEQVLMNLAVNARDAMPDGAPRLPSIRGNRGRDFS